VRVDAGAGGMPELDWLLERGYHVLAKARLATRAELMCRTVERWYADPLHAHREVGWITVDAAEGDERPVRLLGVRGKTKKGEWRYSVDVTTLLPHQSRAVAGELPEGLSRERAEALAVAYAYDKRAGAIEIANKQDKSGLGIAKRQKKRANAQDMLTMLNPVDGDGAGAREAASGRREAEAHRGATRALVNSDFPVVLSPKPRSHSSELVHVREAIP
jgi:hypothetical protein